MEPLEWSPTCFWSTAWWSRPLRNSVADTWDARLAKGPPRPVVLEEGCAGIAAAHLVCKSLGIAVDEESCTCDMKESARVFQKNNLPDVKHCFGSLADHSAGEGFDYRQGRYVVLDHRKACDILVIGPPCQPYSSQRGDRSRTMFDKHPFFRTTFGGPDTPGGSAIEIIRNRLPAALLMEQVGGFCHTDSSTGQSPLSMFIILLKEIMVDGKPYYVAFHVFQMSPEDWLLISRPRTREVSFQTTCGPCGRLLEYER